MRLPCLTVLLLLMAPGMRAGADEPDEPERARRLSDEGLEHFNHARYRHAIESFNASFALRPLPGLLFNLAQAHRLAGDCETALEFYHRYLRERPDATNRALVEGFIAELEPCTPPPAPAPTVMPPPLVLAVPARPLKQPLYKKWWLWTTVAAVAIVAGGVGLGVGLSGGAPAASLGSVSWRP